MFTYVTMVLPVLLVFLMFLNRTPSKGKSEMIIGIITFVLSLLGIVGYLVGSPRDSREECLNDAECKVMEQDGITCLYLESHWSSWPWGKFSCGPNAEETE